MQVSQKHSYFFPSPHLCHYPQGHHCLDFIKKAKKLLLEVLSPEYIARHRGLVSAISYRWSHRVKYCFMFFLPALFLRFIPVVMCSCCSFILPAVFYYLNIPQFIILTIDGYLGCLWFLAVSHIDVMNILVHVS